MTVRVTFATEHDPSLASLDVDIDGNIVTVSALKRCHEFPLLAEEGRFRYAFGSPSEAQVFADILTHDISRLIARMFNAKLVK